MIWRAFEKKTTVVKVAIKKRNLDPASLEKMLEHGFKIHYKLNFNYYSV